MMTLIKRYPYISFTICSILCLYPFMRVYLPVGDEGTLIYDAVRVAQGQIPYRDFFEVMGPGTFYWVALSFKIFGITWQATRIALYVTSVATALMMFFLTRRLRTGFDIFPAIFLMATSFGHIWPAISHHGVSNLLALLSFAAFVIWLDKCWPALLVAAGALAALTTCVLQPKGILLFLAFLVLLTLLCRKEAGFASYVFCLAAGYVAIAVFILLFFWTAGGLHDYVYANFIWPLTRYGNVNSVPYGLGIGEFYWKPWVQSFSAALSPALGYLVAGIFIIPFLIVAAFPILLPTIALCNKSRAFSRALLPYWIAGWALWLSEVHRKDITRLVYGSPLLIILLIYLLSRLKRSSARIALTPITLSVIALAAFNGCLTLAAHVKINTVRGELRMFKKDPLLEFLTTHVTPGEEMFVYSYSPIYYFLSGTINPTKYSLLMYRMTDDIQFRDAVRSLKRSSVRYVVWDNVADSKETTTIFPDYRPPPKNNRPLETYITQHFTVIYQQHGARVLERQVGVPARQPPCIASIFKPLPKDVGAVKSPWFPQEPVTSSKYECRLR